MNSEQILENQTDKPRGSDQALTEPTSDKDFTARRRLLKASAIAPLIATLTPSSALALGSLSCAERNAMDPTLQSAAKATNPGEDQAVRMTATYYEPKRNAGANSPPLYDIGGGSSAAFRATGGELCYTETGDEVWASSSLMSRYRKGQDKQVLVYFDVMADGSPNLRGVWPAAQPGSALANSCLASIGMAGEFDIS